MIILFTLSPMFADGHIPYFFWQNGFLFFARFLSWAFFGVAHSIEPASLFWVTPLLSWALWAQLSPLLSKTSQLSTLLSKSARLSTFLSAQKSRFTLESTFLSGFTLLSAQKSAQKSKTTQNSAQKSAQALPQPTSFNKRAFAVVVYNVEVLRSYLKKLEPLFLRRELEN